MIVTLTIFEEIARRLLRIICQNRALVGSQLILVRIFARRLHHCQISTLYAKNKTKIRTPLKQDMR